MSRIKIVGGGLTGILAAFQAHRLGAREIALYERFDQLGGVALPPVRHGLEMREGCIYFGPKGDPIRSLLEDHGVAFEDFDNAFGSVSPASGTSTLSLADFGGPALPCLDFALSPQTGDSLADRLAAYPPQVRDHLTHYATWHLGHDLADLHADAAIPMAINRVYPVGADLDALAQAKRRDPLANALYAIPRRLWGRTENLTASLPVGGFPELVRRCESALKDLGVTLHPQQLVSPRQALAEHAPGETLVWAASPTPLFKAAGITTPRSPPKSFATYIFEVSWTGPCPFYIQNFTAQGDCFRLYIYESGGRRLLTAECVREAEPNALRKEIKTLMAGFNGDLALGEALWTSVKPRWIYHSLEAITGLTNLRATLRQRMGADFVSGAWEAYAKAEKFAEVNEGLAQALSAKGRAAAA